jgi:hypothetical protein
MKTRVASLAVMATCSVLLSNLVAAAPLDPATVRPVFLALPGNAPGHSAALKPGKVTPLAQWHGSFVDRLGHTVNYTMAGTDPATNNAPTSIPVVIIPLRMVYRTATGTTVFDPNAHVVTGTTSNVTDMTKSSPVFTSTVQWISAHQNLGATQYIDAYQRGNFWKYVQTNRNYHVLLNPITVANEQTIVVDPADGGTEINRFTKRGTIGTMEINPFDAQLNVFMSRIRAVKPSVFPLFLSYNVYLTQFGGCCIGGYHSDTFPSHRSQTYGYATFVDDPAPTRADKQPFSEDISAVSHEVGEWMDDPFVDNAVPDCDDNTGGSLENGDPLEINPVHRYGVFSVRSNGFNFHPQSLVYLPYFGAPRTTSVGKSYSFKGFTYDGVKVCNGQPSP